MNISIIIPAYNEAESLPELTSWIKRVMVKTQMSYEAIIIDDGSKDSTWNVITDLASKDNCIKGVRFRRNYGKSAALHTGFLKAQGDVVVTMDADLQDSPEELPELYTMIIKDGFDLVSGWKKKRYDPLSKTIPTKLYNAVARMMTGIKLHDFNCGLKAYKSEVIKTIEVYGEMHRYIPVLAKRAGFHKIGEKVVLHQKRKFGLTKFGLERFINGPLDLLTILFMTKFGKRPMHFFGTIGTLMFFLGAMSALFQGLQKLYFISNHMRIRLITESPYFYLSLTAMIIGTQLFLAGFLGELISRNSTERNYYQIEKEVNL